MKQIALAAAMLICSTRVDARLIRIVIEQRESPAFRGQSFGPAGQYETLSGRFYGELDPKDPHNSIITDIQFAPRNARGMVEYSATFAISKPIDVSKSSGVLFYTVPNRGGGSPSGSEEGHISFVSGWQGDLLPRAGIQTIAVPVARNQDGTPLTGPVIQRLINLPANTNTFDLTSADSRGLTYQRPLTLDTSKASLTRRTSPGAAGVTIPATDWAFADCSKSPFPGTPEPLKICVKGGFDPESEYTLVFTAKDPLVLGIGYAATRDLTSFLRYAEKDDTGAPNPVAKQVKWALSRGSSQSGNFIRSYIHLGFNQDESG